MQLLMQVVLLSAFCTMVLGLPALPHSEQPWAQFCCPLIQPILPPLLGTGCPPIVSRAQWGARPPRRQVRLTTPVPNVIIHHTAGNRCSSQASCSLQVKGIQNFHMDKRRYDDIAYNFLIGEDGRVYEGRGWTTRGGHTRNWNSKSLGFSFLGTFTNSLPNAAALNAAKHLIRCAVSRGFLSRTYRLKGHRNVGQTSCPGNALYQEIKKWPRFQA
ncbi:peptidoglycan-recognition protein SC2-like [Carettochelys insculpta]|uniref:peptidoglycan-recognition protein SC2-like n=1 Tax=Carettochelys insculpta TaxID=44489 RepID=UPI003EB85620